MKKLLSFFLALLMLLTAVPLGVFAAETVSSLADDPSYNRGYVYTLRTVRAYEHATRNDYSLTIAKGQTGYVVSRPNAGASKDRVEIRYNLDGKAAVAFVDANKVMYYQGDALETMKKDAAVAAGSIKLNNGSPLPPVRYELVPQPTAEPTPEPTPEPTAEPTPEPTAEPVAEVLTPVITPAPIADVNPVETTLPIPGKTVETEAKPEENKAFEFYEAFFFINDGLLSQECADVPTLYDQVYGEGVALPESGHDDQWQDGLYHFTYPEECVSMSVTIQHDFAQPNNCRNCGMVFYAGNEEGVDGSWVYGEGTSTVKIPGNEFTIYAFGCDRHPNLYGFKVLEVTPLQETNITRINVTSDGQIHLEWDNPTNTKYHLVQMAEIDPATGKAGSFTSVQYGHHYPYRNDYTSSNLASNKLYCFRVYLYDDLYTYTNGVYTHFKAQTPFDYASYYAFKQPTLQSGKPMGGTAGLRHQLTWTAVPNASKYQVLRSTSENGTYGIVAETTDTSAIVTAGGFRPFYYKIRAFVNANGRQYGGGTATSNMLRVGYPDTVENVRTTTSATNSYVTITWDKVRNVDGYVIYRSDKSDGTYVKVGNTSPAATGRFVDRTTTVGQTCFYRVRAYVTTPTGNAYSNTSRPSATTYAGHPAIPTGLTATDTESGIGLSWTKTPGATGYAIFRKLEGQSSYTLIGYSDYNGYLDKACTLGETYVYSVRAYRLYNGRKLLSLYSDPASAMNAW